MSTWVGRHSRRYQKAVRYVAQRITALGGQSAMPGEPFADSWQAFVTDRVGLRHYRQEDWNEFWHAVILQTVIDEIEILKNLRKKVSNEYLRDKIRTHMVKKSQQTIIQRSTLLAQYADSEEQLIQFSNLIGKVLDEARDQCDESKEDCPRWYRETYSLWQTLETARLKYLNKENKG